MPNSRQISGTATPASARLSASITWLSVNFDFFMQNLLFEKILLPRPANSRGDYQRSPLDQLLARIPPAPDLLVIPNQLILFD